MEFAYDGGGMAKGGDVTLDDHDHFIDPQERLRIVISRQ
jgi:hypothetical protein